MVVYGSGGHTGEMLPVVHSLAQTSKIQKITYVSANTDTISRLQPAPQNVKDITHVFLPRSRNVGQSFITSVFTTFNSLLAAIPLAVHKPDLLLVNGPGVCFPVVISMFIGNLLGITNCSIVFIESFCRVETLSLTGKLIYPLCDIFFVHWEKLAQMRKRAKLINIFHLNQ